MSSTWVESRPLHPELVGRLDPLVEPQRADAEDLGQRRFGFRRHAVLQATLELPQDRLLAVPAHADDERNAEFLAVGIVVAVEGGVFRLRQPVEAGAGLLGLGIGRHGAGARRLAGEVGMALEQRHPLFHGRLAHRRDHRLVQRGERGERPPPMHGLRHPRRVLVDVAQRGDEARLVGGIQVRERDGAS